jgi:hypothetical protein
MKIVIFILLIFITSCSDLIDEEHVEINSIARPAYNNFIKSALDHGLDFRHKSIIIKVDNLPENKRGITSYNETILTITLNKNYISDLESQMQYYDTQYYLEFTVFHELGHAFLLRAHLPNGSYSIMTCCMEEAWDYVNNDTRIKLQDELFNRKYFYTQ